MSVRYPPPLIQAANHWWADPNDTILSIHGSNVPRYKSFVIKNNKYGAGMYWCTTNNYGGGWLPAIFDTYDGNFTNGFGAVMNEYFYFRTPQHHRGDSDANIYITGYPGPPTIIWLTLPQAIQPSSYIIRSTSVEFVADYCPRKWDLFGTNETNDTGWVLLHSVDNEASWGPNQTRTYTPNYPWGTGSFARYKWAFYRNNWFGGGLTPLQIGEMALFTPGGTVLPSGQISFSDLKTALFPSKGANDSLAMSELYSVGSRLGTPTSGTIYLSDFRGKSTGASAMNETRVGVPTTPEGWTASASTWVYNGATFTFSASVNSENAWKLFDGDKTSISSGWDAGVTTYQSGTGDYTGTSSTSAFYQSNAFASTLTGEWIQVSCNRVMNLYRCIFTFMHDPTNIFIGGRAPKFISIVASLDEGTPSIWQIVNLDLTGWSMPTNSTVTYQTGFGDPYTGRPPYEFTANTDFTEDGKNSGLRCRHVRFIFAKTWDVYDNAIVRMQNINILANVRTPNAE